MEQSVVAALQRSALGARCARPELIALAEQLTVVDLAAGDTLLEAGSTADAAYIVLQGELEIRSPDGTFLDRDGPGALVGEQALLPGGSGARNATVVAVDLVRVLRVEAALFTAFLAERAERLARVEADADDKTRNRLGRLSTPFQHLLSAGERQTFGEGESVFHEGDPADGLHLVLAGQAEVVTERGGEPVHLTTVYPGQCFGELATLRNVPRTASVVARAGLRTAFVPAAAVRSLHAAHPDLEQFLQSLVRTYTLPRRGTLHQRTAFVDGAACIETVYVLDDGRELTALRTPTGHYTLSSPGATVARTLAVSPGTTVSLDADHRIVSIEDTGTYDDLAGLQELTLDGSPLSVQQRRTLRRAARAAKLLAPDATLCRCMGLDRNTLQAAIDQGAHTCDALQAATGCGTVCGSCMKVDVPAMLPATDHTGLAGEETTLAPAGTPVPRMPKLIPWLGNWSFSRDPAGFQQRGHARLGPVFAAHLMGVDFVFVDPARRPKLADRIVSGTVDGLDSARARETLAGRVLGAPLGSQVPDLTVEALPDDLWEAVDRVLDPHLGTDGPIDPIPLASDGVTAVLCALRHPSPGEAPFVDELARTLDTIAADWTATTALMPVQTATLRRRIAARDQLVRIVGPDTAAAFVASHRNATLAVVWGLLALLDQPDTRQAILDEVDSAEGSVEALSAWTAVHAAVREAALQAGGGALWRQATHDVVVDGHAIRAGALVGTTRAVAGGAALGPGTPTVGCFDAAFGRRTDTPGLGEVAAALVLARLLQRGAWTRSTDPERRSAPILPTLSQPEGDVRVDFTAP